ncbi:MAG: D-glycerate dehydrogenase, partial [Phenylobacterium sp.]|nr:D-glycerate dehydrogenase [Phenylobacterium sp.]
MASRKPKVIVTRKLPDPVETRMRELFDTELNVADEPMSRKQLIDAVGRCDVLSSTITDKIDASLIEKAGER